MNFRTAACFSKEEVKCFGDQILLFLSETEYRSKDSEFQPRMSQDNVQNRLPFTKHLCTHTLSHSALTDTPFFR